MYSVPFGNGQLMFDLPRRMSGALARPKHMPPLNHMCQAKSSAA
jgi:hypothetical protein